ncbi:MAG TPA: phosphomannomutase [Nitrosopumilaceae archaeon]|nr:phosphomannomutase [Nitrosopumilaceae archaeon]
MPSEFIKSLCALDSLKVSISGVRGIFGHDLNLSDIIKFCQNFSLLVKSKKCVVAQDTRPSSKILSEVVIASLMERGLDVYNLGIAPTPVAFRESRKYGSGVIITSSHNPLEWNGLKFIIDGRGINEKELKQITQKSKFSKEKMGSEFQSNSSYISDVTKLIGKVKGSPKVAIDVGGGAAFEVAPKMLEKIGCSIQKINGKPGISSRGPDPTYECLRELNLATKRCDIGFAFDLDGDRLVVVQNGKKQSPDVTLGLGVAKALEIGYKRFVLSIDTSVSIEKFIKTHGGQVQRSKVGEANVVDLMLKTHSQAGGEGSSAGFILPEFNMCRDGLLTSGLIASMLGTKTFANVMKFMGHYIQLRSKVEAESKFHKKTLQILLDKMKKQYSEIITLDGIKSIIDEDSWVLVRQSNTEHIIRISTESDDLKKAKDIQKQVTKLVNQSYEQARRSRNN